MQCFDDALSIAQEMLQCGGNDTKPEVGEWLWIFGKKLDS